MLVNLHLIFLTIFLPNSDATLECGDTKLQTREQRFEFPSLLLFYKGEHNTIIYVYTHNLTIA